MEELDLLHPDLRVNIAQKMIDYPDLAALRLRSLKSILPIEVKFLLEDATISFEFWGNQSAKASNVECAVSIIYPVVAVDHGHRPSLLHEPENLIWLQCLTFKVYEFTGIAHVLAKGAMQHQVSSYSPITKKYRLWSTSRK